MKSLSIGLDQMNFVMKMFLVFQPLFQLAKHFLLLSSCLINMVLCICKYTLVSWLAIFCSLKSSFIIISVIQNRPLLLCLEIKLSRAFKVTLLVLVQFQECFTLLLWVCYQHWSQETLPTSQNSAQDWVPHRSLQCCGTDQHLCAFWGHMAQSPVPSLAWAAEHGLP